MMVSPTALPEVLLIQTRPFTDARGYFLEIWNERRYREIGISGPFVQDNLSASLRGVIRGLHFQHPSGQGKLISVLEGEVFDVAVDIRVGSPRFGRWVGVNLSAGNHLQMYLPVGFAHGFLCLSERCLFSYKCTEFYNPAHERSIRWNDPDLGIHWPLSDEWILSNKDLSAPVLSQIDPTQLPTYQPEHS
jgi:dTDP-4-dehydrorhamnose 3,5-epimerase